MRRPLIYSSCLHAAVLALVFIGLPILNPQPVMVEPAMTVDLVMAGDSGSPRSAPAPKAVARQGEVASGDDAPPPKAKPAAPEARPEPQRPPPPVQASAVREPEPTVKPAPKVAPVSKPEPSKSNPPKPEPSKPAPVKPAEPPHRSPIREAVPPVVKESAPMPKAEAAKPPKPAVPPRQAVAEKPPAAAKPKDEIAKTASREAASKPPPPSRQAVASAEPQKPRPPAPASDAGDFTAVTKAVRELNGSGSGMSAATASRPAAGPPPQSAGSIRTGSAAGPAASSSAISSAPVTGSEIDAVRRQIEQCWNIPASLKGGNDLVVAIKVQMNEDGRPRTAEIQPNQRIDSDPTYRAAAESAKRAVLNPRCHPFKLPKEKFQQWRSLTLIFRPGEMLGA
jgi:hypothetical protein